MKTAKIIIISVFFVLLASCNAVKVNNDWPPNCCGPDPILPPGNAGKFVDSVNTNNSEVAPVQRPYYSDSYEMANPLDREFNTVKQGEFDGVNSSQYFFSRISKKNSRNKRLIDYLTNNVESISFTDRNNGFIALSHPPTEEFAEIMNFNAKGIKGGTDIFEFKLDDDTDYIFENLSPVSGINTVFWESHTFAAQKLVKGIVHTVLLWSTDKENPFSKVIYKDETEKVKGSTEIYYSFKVGNEWSQPDTIKGLNDEIAYDGTPFLYCLCEDSYIFFSSNRNDPTKSLVDKSIIEDFDIFFANIVIDFEGKEIRLKDGRIPEPFKKYTEKIKEEDALKDYLAINSTKDDRFPFVPNPLSSGENDTTYLYFSSNRNYERTEVEGTSDFVLKNAGEYDIYRHPLDIPCIENKRTPPKLIVDLIDAKTGDKIKEPVVKLFLDDKEIKTIKGENPAVFDSLDFNKRYEIYGGSEYSTGDENNCGTYITDYFEPQKEQYKIILSDTIHYFERKVIQADQLQNYLDGVKTTDVDIDKYNDYRLFNVDRVSITKIDTSKNSIDFIDNNKVAIDIKTIIYDSGEETAFYTITGEDVVTSNTFDKVNSGKARSDRTMSGGVYTYSLKGGEVLKDVIYLATDSSKVQCKQLLVKVHQKCNPDNPIKQPCIRIEEYDTANDKWINANNKLDIIKGGFDKDEVMVGLIYGKKYRVFGGSNYKYVDECSGEYYYTSADTEPADKCVLTYTKAEEAKYKPAYCDVYSELTKFGEIDTREIEEDLIQDEIILKPVDYVKPECDYDFTEIFTEYRRRVPYFQTAFWQVNTKDNYNQFVRKINRSNSIYMKNYTVPNGDRKGQGWPGAKWIELHPNNTYWNKDKSPESWNRRKREYYQFARTVDNNLDQMAQIIHDSLLVVYDKIIGSENCVDCDNKKFVVEVEAWSDYRPVEYGWYLPTDDDPKIVKYAECGDIIGFNGKNASEYFNPVKVVEDDPLGSDNKNLSILRAYFGYNALLDRIKSYKNDKNLFNEYMNNELILTPDMLIDEKGNLLGSDRIEEMVRNSKIILIAKGYETTENPEYSPKFTEDGSKVDVPRYAKMKELSTYYNLDTIRTVQVKIRQLEYKDKMKHDDCCTPRVERSAFKINETMKKEKAYFEDDN